MAEKSLNLYDMIQLPSKRYIPVSIAKKYADEELINKIPLSKTILEYKERKLKDNAISSTAKLRVFTKLIQTRQFHKLRYVRVKQPYMRTPFNAYDETILLPFNYFFEYFTCDYSHDEAFATAIGLDGVFDQKCKNIVIKLDRSHNLKILTYYIEHEWQHKLITEIAGREASSQWDNIYKQSWEDQRKIKRLVLNSISKKKEKEFNHSLSSIFFHNRYCKKYK